MKVSVRRPSLPSSTRDKVKLLLKSIVVGLLGLVLVVLIGNVVTAAYVKYNRAPIRQEQRQSIYFQDSKPYLKENSYNFVKKETKIWDSGKGDWKMQASMQSSPIKCSRVVLTSTGVEMLGYCVNTSGNGYVYASLEGGQLVAPSCMDQVGMLFNAPNGSILVTDNTGKFQGSPDKGCKLLN